MPLPSTAAPPRPPAPPQIDLDDDIFKVDFMKIFGEPERALSPSQYQGIHLPERGRVGRHDPGLAGSLWSWIQFGGLGHRLL